MGKVVVLRRPGSVSFMPRYTSRKRADAARAGAAREALGERPLESGGIGRRKGEDEVAGEHGDMARRVPSARTREAIAHVAVTCLMLAVSTAIGVGFRQMGFADASIISLYILTTLLVAVSTTGRACTLLSSIASVVLYNFYFVAPIYTLESLDKSYLVTFAIMFVAAVVASELTRNIAQNARRAADAAAVARNEQMRANLLRSLGHDLRTPITAIAGSAAILADEDGRLAPEKRSELARAIARDARWLGDMVENVLTVTRIEDGTLSLNLAVELVDEVLAAAVEHVAQDGCHRIRIEPSREYLFARMDVNLVIQLIVNLVSNALKYTPADSTVTLSARRAGDFVAITVADDGPGVPDADKPHIFDRFYRGDQASPVDARRGFGLGLALCRSIAEAHGGTIEVADRAPHGAAFTFTLPAEEVTIHE